MLFSRARPHARVDAELAVAHDKRSFWEVFQNTSPSMGSHSRRSGAVELAAQPPPTRKPPSLTRRCVLPAPHLIIRVQPFLASELVRAQVQN